MVYGMHRDIFQMLNDILQVEICQLNVAITIILYFFSNSCASQDFFDFPNIIHLEYHLFISRHCFLLWLLLSNEAIIIIYLCESIGTVYSTLKYTDDMRVQVHATEKIERFFVNIRFSLNFEIISCPVNPSRAIL